MSSVDLYVEMERTHAFRPMASLSATRRSLIEGVGLRFCEGIIHEDLLFNLQTVPLAQRAEFLNEPLYWRRMREGSTMTQAFSMRNVHGLFTVAQTLRSWLDREAPNYSRAFCDAFAARVYDTYHIAARYLFDIDENDVEVYRDGLDARTRADFDMHVLELHRSLKGIYDEVCGSLTYRVGRVFVALPSWVKSRVKMPQAKPGE